MIPKFAKKKHFSLPTTYKQEFYTQKNTHSKSLSITYSVISCDVLSLGTLYPE